MSNQEGSPIKVRHRPAVQHELPVRIAWIPGEPPEPNPQRFTSSYNHAWIAEELRSAPGVWAKLEGLPATLASAMQSGQLSAYRPGGLFEAVTRGEEVYARYVGEVDAKAKFMAELEEALAELDGTPESSIRVLTGLSREDLADYGGMPEGAS